MNDKKGDQSSRDITLAILTRFMVVMFIYSVSLLIILLGGRYLSSKIIWHGNELLYPLLKAIENNALSFLIFCWLIGFAVIFIIYWNKTLSYVQKVADASNLLVEPNEELIHLPPELKQVEKRMNQAKQDALRNARMAKEAEKRKNDLIVYLAHDLKTPLTSVIGYLSLLRDEKQITEELREKYLSISLEKAERLEDLINEFFEITRFNLSQPALETSRVNLSRMLEQIAFEFKPMFASKNLQYTLEADSTIEIKCDVNKMERVFDNLIRNAVNYSFENSTIGIEAHQDKRGVDIRFRNQGNTIPKEKLDRIFEQFYRLDVSRASKTGGAGLGLAIAKEIIELHHGSIQAYSEDEMIEFTVFLPNAP